MLCLAISLRHYDTKEIDIINRFRAVRLFLKAMWTSVYDSSFSELIMLLYHKVFK